MDLVFHAAKDEKTARKILDEGFKAIQTRDSGWFGHGVYFSHDLPYVQKEYGDWILVCLVAYANFFPFVDGDLKPEVRSVIRFRVVSPTLKSVSVQMRPGRVNQLANMTRMLFSFRRKIASTLHLRGSFPLPRQRKNGTARASTLNWWWTTAQGYFRSRLFTYRCGRLARPVTKIRMSLARALAATQDVPRLLQR